MHRRRTPEGDDSPDRQISPPGVVGPSDACQPPFTSAQLSNPPCAHDDRFHRDALIGRLGLRPPTGTTRVTDAQLRRALVAEAHAALQPHRAAERQARLQAERAREERARRRFARARAANAAVDEYMRTSGTRNYQAAFSYIQHTRPELFADPQVPAHEAVAGNFNPNHDRLGRFSTSEDAAAPHGGHLPATTSKDASARHGRGFPTFGVHDLRRHPQHGERPAQHEGKEAGQTHASPESVGSIAHYQRSSTNNATCVAVAIWTMIGTMKQKDGPTVEAIKAQVEAVSREISKTGPFSIDWRSGSGINVNSTDYAAVVQKVLSLNGVKSTNNLGHDANGKPVVNMFPMAGLADTLIAKGTPAILNVGEKNSLHQHSVTVQWNPEAAGGQGRFLVNNVLALGGTDSYTRKQFESGVFRANDNTNPDDRKTGTIPINREYVTIFADHP